MNPAPATPAPGDPPVRAPLPRRALAAATLALTALAALLTALADRPTDPTDHPLALALGQTLYNAAQTTHLLHVLALTLARPRAPTLALAALSLAPLPFAHYLIAPGGALYAALITLTALATLRAPAPLTLHYAPLAGRRLRDGVIALELIALLCNLGSTLYNYNHSRSCPPYWDALFRALGDTLGLTAPLADTVRPFYTLGLDLPLPPFVPIGAGSNPLGALVFLTVWSILPTLYVLYFVILALGSRAAPYPRIQQALCLFAIAHFLFFTDLVDYRFGRGLTNPLAEWLHWTERFSWRIAILLPLWQKLTTHHWKHHGRLGHALHLTVAAWAITFFVYQVLTYDLVRFYHFATDTPQGPLLLFLRGTYHQELGYHGALVLMVLLYAFLLWRMPSNGLAIHPRPR